MGRPSCLSAPTIRRPAQRTYSPDQGMRHVGRKDQGSREAFGHDGVPGSYNVRYSPSVTQGKGRRMITVWGGQTSRSIRVVWVLEEMGLPYRVRQVDMLAAEQDPEFLAINPADYIPAIQDGDVVMV